MFLQLTIWLVRNFDKLHVVNMGNTQQKLRCYSLETDMRKELGRGLFGVVIPGIRIRDKLKIAAKKIKIEKEFMGEEYEQEADILLHKLKPNEHVLRVYDFFKEDVVDKGIQWDLCWSFYQMIYIINTPHKCNKCIFIVLSYSIYISE